MATHAALDTTTWLGGYDITGQTNETSLKISWDEKDATVYTNRARQRAGTLQDIESKIKGFWLSDDEDAPDPELISGLGTTTQAVTQSVDGLEGSVAYFYQSRRFSYQFGADIGELLPFEAMIKGSRGNGSRAHGAVRGRVVADVGAVSATGPAGTAVNLGAVAADQFLYAALHVFSAGTTVTVQVQSDDAVGFGSPTTQGTIGPITAKGGTWMTRVAGPITDTWWRFNVSAITGTFVLAGPVGIQ